tara:strand:+ start:1438 stop:2031 length:594 start_codon:yes stop_codon:yes gene_type:complete
MSIQALNWCIKAKTDTPTTKLVLFLLSNYADENGSCYPSEKKLAELVQVSDRQIRRCLKWLIDNGLVRAIQRSGTSNRYFLCMDTSVQTSAEAHALPVRTPASTNTKDYTKDIYTEEFQEFWVMYPRKVGKHAAAKSFMEARKSAQFKKIMKAAFAFKQENVTTEERFIPHAQTWLNQKRYLDTIAIKTHTANTLAG